LDACEFGFQILDLNCEVYRPLDQWLTAASVWIAIDRTNEMNRIGNNMVPYIPVSSFTFTLQIVSGDFNFSFRNYYSSQKDPVATMEMESHRVMTD
jgi:hypothetical protein